MLVFCWDNCIPWLPSSVIAALMAIFSVCDVFALWEAVSDVSKLECGATIMACVCLFSCSFWADKHHPVALAPNGMFRPCLSLCPSAAPSRMGPSSGRPPVLGPGWHASSYVCTFAYCKLCVVHVCVFPCALLLYRRKALKPLRLPCCPLLTMVSLIHSCVWLVSSACCGAWVCSLMTRPHPHS